MLREARNRQQQQGRRRRCDDGACPAFCAVAVWLKLKLPTARGPQPTDGLLLEITLQFAAKWGATMAGYCAGAVI